MLQDPLDEVNRLRGRLRRLLDDSFAPPREVAVESRPGVPPADIHASEGRVVVSLEVPGMSSDELEVTLEGRALTVTGRPAAMGETPPETVLHRERRGGAFVRAFTLGWEPTAYDARLRDGVLRVMVER